MNKDTLVRVTAKLVPDKESAPVTVFFAGPAREKFQRVLSRREAARFDLGGFCPFSSVPKGKGA